MRDRELDRKKELKKDIEHFGDPFQTYGFGLVAYRMTITRLARVFLFFAIISLPILMTYRSGSAIGIDSKYGWSTIGNLGYNTIQFSNSIMAMGLYQLQCPYGKITELIDYDYKPNIDSVQTEKRTMDFTVCLDDMTPEQRKLY